MRSSYIKHGIFIITAVMLFLCAAGVSGEENPRLNMTYLYYGDSDSYRIYIENSKGSVQEVSPDFFYLSSDGSFNTSEDFSISFINDMQKKGIRVIPYLSNHWSRKAGQNALAKREALAEEVALVIDKYNLDGINIDIENLKETDRDNYTDFIRLLREKINPGKSLTVAAAANPKGINTGWAASYDYSMLSLYCDYIMLMAYDESYEGSTPGPVASYDYVEESIQYALNCGVHPSKLVLGIPFYGRYWQKGRSFGGYGIGMSDIERLIKKYSAPVIFDRSSKSAVTVINIKSSEYVFDNIKKLYPGTYTIWYENDKSIKYKLSLAAKYNLRGTGSWCLGYESRDIWDFYTTYLNGSSYVDVTEHWAIEPVEYITQKNWMKGTGKSEFSPDEKATRAHAAVVMVRALGLENSYPGADFEDTKDHWAREEIAIARYHGIMEGIGNNLFEPDKNITREEMAVLTDRVFMKGSEAPEFKHYSDVSMEGSPWSFVAIGRMSGWGVFNGYPDKSFKPLSAITRAEMAAILMRICAMQ